MSRGSERFSWRAALVTVGTIAVAGWIGYEYSQWPPPPPDSRQVAAQSDERAPKSTPPTRIALLTDSPPADDSWFARALNSPNLSGFVAGRVPQGADANTAGLLPLVDRVSGSDWVIVQSGNSDVLLGRTSEEIAADVIDVLRAVGAAGPEVIWATTLPLAADGDEVLELNAQVAAWAQRNDVAVLDLFGAVGDSDGTYVDGLSDDGAEPNQSALEAQTRAVRRQLPALLRVGGSGG